MRVTGIGDAYVHVTYRCNILCLHAFRHHDSVLMHWSGIHMLRLSELT
jgi:hypothetical protein